MVLIKGFGDFQIATVFKTRELKMPLFSVIVPTFNRASYLPRCLDSVRGQRFADWECIVVDDGSTDASADIVEMYTQTDSRFRGFAQNNCGAASARNHGARVASGKWLCFLDSDDFYFPGALLAYSDAYAASAGHQPPPLILSGILHGDFASANSQTTAGHVSVDDAFGTTYGVSSKGPAVFLQSAAIARELLDTVGAFSPAYCTGEDREFLIRATAVSPTAHIIRRVAYYTKLHGMGKSDRYLANGEKLTVARRIYDDLDHHPAIQGRFGVGKPEHADYRRWSRCYRLMLDGAQAVRAGQFYEGAEKLKQLDAACATKDELISLIRRLLYFLYFPPTAPRVARQRCASWFFELANEIEAGPRHLYILIHTIANSFCDD